MNGQQRQKNAGLYRPSFSTITVVLSQYGEVELEQFEYLRFKSNNNGLSKTKKHIWEQLYILRRL